MNFTSIIESYEADIGPEGSAFTRLRLQTGHIAFLNKNNWHLFESYFTALNLPRYGSPSELISQTILMKIPFTWKYSLSTAPDSTIIPRITLVGADK